MKVICAECGWSGKRNKPTAYACPNCLGPGHAIAPAVAFVSVTKVTGEALEALRKKNKAASDARLAEIVKKLIPLVAQIKESGRKVRSARCSAMNIRRKLARQTQEVVQ